MCTDYTKVSDRVCSLLIVLDQSMHALVLTLVHTPVRAPVRVRPVRAGTPVRGPVRCCN